MLLERPRLRVTTIKREGANGGSYDAWSTDGAYIEQFSSATKTHTRRRIRSAPDGLDDADLPAAAALRDELVTLGRNRVVIAVRDPAGNVARKVVRVKVDTTDQFGRYAYGNQPAVAEWNLARLAETYRPA